MKPAYHLKLFEACGVQEVCARDQICSYPAKNEEIYIWHCSMSKKFSCHVTLLLKRKLQHVGHMWVTSELFCGLVGQMGQQV